MSEIPRDLSKATESLGDAIERFQRRVARAATRKVMRHRIGRRLGRLPAPASHRPTRHRVAWPIQYRRASARTILDRVRQIEDTRRDPNSFAAAVRRAAGRAADAVRRRLDALRRALSRLRGRRAPVR